MVTKAAGGLKNSPTNLTGTLLHDRRYYFLAIYVKSNILVYNGLL